MIRDVIKTVSAVLIACVLLLTSAAQLALAGPIPGYGTYITFKNGTDYALSLKYDANDDCNNDTDVRGKQTLDPGDSPRGYREIDPWCKDGVYDTFKWELADGSGNGFKQKGQAKLHVGGVLSQDCWVSQDSYYHTLIEDRVFIDGKDKISEDNGTNTYCTITFREAD